jgi:hypothetical protein
LRFYSAPSADQPGISLVVIQAVRTVDEEFSNLGCILIACLKFPGKMLSDTPDHWLKLVSPTGRLPGFPMLREQFPEK